WIGPVAGAGVGLAVGVVLPPFGGATVLLGLAAGMLAAAVQPGLGRNEAPEVVDWLAVGLAAALAAATVEAAFGIGTVGPDTLLWGLAGLAAAATGPQSSEAMAEGAAPQRRHRGATRRGARQITVGWQPAAAAVGLAFGLVAALFVLGLLVTSAADRPADAIAVTLLMVVVSTAAGALAAALAGTSALGAAAAALVVVAAFAVVRASVLAVSGAPLLWAVAMWAAVAMALLAGFWLRTPGPVKAPARGARAWFYVVAAAAAVTVVQLVAVRRLQADIEFQMAMADSAAAVETDDAARFRDARSEFDRATKLRPREAFYYLKWGELYTRLGQAAAADPEAAAAAFGQAQEYAARAEAAEPLMPYHTFNRGHVQLVFAQQLSGGQQAAVARNAAVALQEAFDAVPSDPRIASELAMARLLSGDHKAARDLMNYVLTLTPDDPEAYLNLGRATEAGGDLDGARAAYELALAKEGPRPRLDTRLALGELARQQDDNVAARGWYEQAAEASPNSWFVQYNLGLLYRDTQDPQLAVSALSRALSLAPESERQRVQAVLDSLLRAAP
ncbi:MAG: tetratricopeptide repeat protein, partial [Anaerolineae bacterium]